MQQFVILFRQSPNQPLTEQELTQRAAQTRRWAQQWTAAGHNLNPRILSPESHWFSANGDSGPAPTTVAGPVTALLFLDAVDLDQAMMIARSHPAVWYQASVEVRAWSSPAAQP